MEGFARSQLKLVLGVMTLWLGIPLAVQGAGPHAKVVYAPLERWEATALIPFEEMGLPEAALSALESLTQWGRYDGWDQKRPFGRVWFEQDGETDEVWVIPYTDLAAAMHVITIQGVVEYRQVADNHIEIDRPDEPYHVVLRDGYLLMTEWPALVTSAPGGPTEWLTLKENELLAMSIDPVQLSPTVRDEWRASVAASLEPNLQPYDGEYSLTAGLRRWLGQQILELLSLAIQQTRQLTCSLSVKSAPTSKPNATEKPAAMALDLAIDWQFTDNATLASAISPTNPPTQLPATLPYEQIMALAVGIRLPPSEPVQLAAAEQGNTTSAPLSWQFARVLRGQAKLVELVDARWILTADWSGLIPLSPKKTAPQEKTESAQQPLTLQPLTQWSYDEPIGQQPLPWSMRFAPTDRTKLTFLEEKWQLRIGQPAALTPEAEPAPATNGPLNKPVTENTVQDTPPPVTGLVIAMFRGRVLLPWMEGTVRRGLARGFAFGDDQVTITLNARGNGLQLDTHANPGWLLAAASIWQNRWLESQPAR